MSNNSFSAVKDFISFQNNKAFFGFNLGTKFSIDNLLYTIF